jgi:hypothetical protein
MNSDKKEETMTDQAMKHIPPLFKEYGMKITLYCLIEWLNEVPNDGDYISSLKHDLKGVADRYDKRYEFLDLKEPKNPKKGKQNESHKNNKNRRNNRRNS